MGKTGAQNQNQNQKRKKMKEETETETETWAETEKEQEQEKDEGKEKEKEKEKEKFIIINEEENEEWNDWAERGIWIEKEWWNGCSRSDLYLRSMSIFLMRRETFFHLYLFVCTFT